VFSVCRLLWEFIYQLLQERTTASKNYVCWDNNGLDLVFRIVNPTGKDHTNYVT
jgi:hypothetical protein